MFWMRKLGVYTAAAVVLLGAVLPVVASAQTPPVRPPLRLMTSPLPLNVITKPGQTVTADLRVKNNGTTPEQLKVELLKFGAEGDTGRPQLQERDPRDLYFSWVSFSETNFTAEPNVWKTIKMTINAPKEAAFGYYFAVLFTRSNPDRPTGGASGVEGGVASLVLLNVDAPGARREAKVAEIVASQKVYEFLPAKLTVKLRNSGNVHVAPVGSMFIKQGSKQVGSMNFNVERGNILPGTNRVFELEWADGFPVYKEKEENGKTSTKLEWNFGDVQKLRFGKYTATLVAVYDDGQRDIPVEAVVSFWVIPWRILGVLLLVILLIGAGVWAFMRMIWKNVRRQAVVRTVPDEGPDPNSLAAATKSKKSKKTNRHQTTEATTHLDSPVQPLYQNDDAQKTPQHHKKDASHSSTAAPMSQEKAAPSHNRTDEPRVAGGGASKNKNRRNASHASEQHSPHRNHKRKKNKKHRRRNE